MDSSGSRKQDDRPMPTQFFTQARRLRPTRKRIWLRLVFADRGPTVRRSHGVASSTVANLLE